MRASPRAVLTAYLLIMFATLPLLPPLVTLVRNRLGTGPLSGVLYALLATFLLPPLWRLAAPPRPRPPWPHLSLFLLVILAAAVLGTLVSSPIGRVHLAEYGLLAVLILRVLPRKPGVVPYLAACVMTALAFSVTYFLVFLLATSSFLLGGSVLATKMVSWVVNVYCWIVAMRCIGLYYHHFKSRFAWSWG